MGMWAILIFFMGMLINGFFFKKKSVEFILTYNYGFGSIQFEPIKSMYMCILGMLF
jgi:hypothetical protein